MFAAATPPAGFDKLHQGLYAMQTLTHTMLVSKGMEPASVSEFLSKPLPEEKYHKFLSDIKRFFSIGIIEFCIKILTSLWGIIFTIGSTFYSFRFVYNYISVIKTKNKTNTEAIKTKV